MEDTAVLGWIAKASQAVMILLEPSSEEQDNQLFGKM